MIKMDSFFAIGSIDNDAYWLECFIEMKSSMCYKVDDLLSSYVAEALPFRL